MLLRRHDLQLQRHKQKRCKAWNFSSKQYRRQEFCYRDNYHIRMRLQVNNSEKKILQRIGTQMMRSKEMATRVKHMLSFSHVYKKDYFSLFHRWRNKALQQLGTMSLLLRFQNSLVSSHQTVLEHDKGKRFVCVSKNDIEHKYVVWGSQISKLRKPATKVNVEMPVSIVIGKVTVVLRKLPVDAQVICFSVLLYGIICHNGNQAWHKLKQSKVPKSWRFKYKTIYIEFV